MGKRFFRIHSVPCYNRTFRRTHRKVCAPPDCLPAFGNELMFRRGLQLYSTYISPISINVCPCGTCTIIHFISPCLVLFGRRETRNRFAMGLIIRGTQVSLMSYVLTGLKSLCKVGISLRSSLRFSCYRKFFGLLGWSISHPARLGSTMAGLLHFTRLIRFWHLLAVRPGLSLLRTALWQAIYWDPGYLWL